MLPPAHMPERTLDGGREYLPFGTKLIEPYVFGLRLGVLKIGQAPGLLRGLVGFDIRGDKLLDLCGWGCAVRLAGSTVRFQYVRLQVKREADVVFSQVFLL